MKLRWTKKHCILSVLGNENNNADTDSNNTIFTIKDAKLYVPASLIRKRQPKIIKTS